MKTKNVAKSARLPHDVAIALQAMQEAVAEVHEESRRTGKPIPIWRDGKVVWIIPEKETAPPPPAPLSRRRVGSRRNGRRGRGKK
jgi:hypothetical protein